MELREMGVWHGNLEKKGIMELKEMVVGSRGQGVGPGKQGS